MRQSLSLCAIALAACLAGLTLAAHGQTSGAARDKPAPPSYGPVLNPRQPQTADPARKDPAEVRDEADSLARETQPQSQPQSPSLSQQQSPQQLQQQLQQQSQQPRQPQRQRHAWEPAGPPAPRPLRSADAQPIGSGAVPIPAPAQAPQPVVPSSRALNSCVGGACRDAAGGSYNMGPTGVGVSGSGRLCSTSGSTVQCF